MRKLLWLCPVALAATLMSQPAKAGSWCAVISIDSGATRDICTFNSFEACQAEARINGPTSFCRTNGYAAPAYEARAVRKKKRHHE